MFLLFLKPHEYRLHLHQNEQAHHEDVSQSHQNELAVYSFLHAPSPSTGQCIDSVHRAHN
jgi:hypothetical protein